MLERFAVELDECREAVLKLEAIDITSTVDSQKVDVKRRQDIPANLDFCDLECILF